MNRARSEYNAKLVEVAVGNVKEASHQAPLIRTRASYEAVFQFEGFRLFL